MKRSSQVVLLLMGVTGAGAAAYAVMPPRSCIADNPPAKLAPAAPGALAPQTLNPGALTPAQPAIADPCPPRRRWSSSGRSSSWYWHSSNYNSTDTAPARSGGLLFSPSRSHTSVPSVGSRSSSTSLGGSGGSSRGGFGSTGHSAGAHASG